MVSQRHHDLADRVPRLTRGGSSSIFQLPHGSRASSTDPGIEAAPLGEMAASRSDQLYHFAHRDPADRLLIATAIELDCLMVTYNERIVRCGVTHGRQYRLRVGT